jgi:hypothetical protein
VAEAQSYTWETLASARRTGRCQLTPNRLFTLDPEAAPGARCVASTPSRRSLRGRGRPWPDRWSWPSPGGPG